MKIKVIHLPVPPTPSFPYVIGTTLTVDDKLALDWIRLGYAVQIQETSKRRKRAHKKRSG